MKLTYHLGSYGSLSIIIVDSESFQTAAELWIKNYIFFFLQFWPYF